MGAAKDELDRLVDAVAEVCRDQVTEQVRQHIEQGLDMRGMCIANVVLSDRIRERITTEVGNYLRCNEYQIKQWINEAITDQMRGVITASVSQALRKTGERINATLKAAVDAVKDEKE
jgi:hypothetical protein